MITLIKNALFRADLAELQQQVIREQQKTITELRRLLEEKNLQYLKEMEGFCSAFLISIEQPEIDIRDELSSLLQAFSEHIAVMEEHVL